MSEHLAKLLESGIIDVERLLEEEEELRKISPEEGAHGRNSSDYRNMYDYYMDIVQQHKSILKSASFVDKRGNWNHNLINAWTKMVSTGMKAIEALNKMRNTDRMVGDILGKHTLRISVEVSGQISREIGKIVEMARAGEDRVVIIRKLEELQKIGLVSLFTTAAKDTLASTKEEFSLLH